MYCTDLCDIDETIIVGAKALSISNSATDYPSILVGNGGKSSANVNVDVMKTVFQRFNQICSSRNQINKRPTISDKPTNAVQPDYWIGRWSRDDTGNFGYQLSDGSMGMLFDNEEHLMHTPNQLYVFHLQASCFTLLINNRFAFSIRNWTVSSTGHLQFKTFEHDTKFSEMRDRLVQNGTFVAETEHNRWKLPHLVTWFQTDEAILMYLSNHTVQVS